MVLLISITSIVAFAALAWLMEKVPHISICPICAGVSVTWIGMLVGLYVGFPIDSTILSMLMGGSVVGIAYRLESRLNPNRSPLLFKLLLIPIGFVSVISLIEKSWGMAILAILTCIIVIGLFTKTRTHRVSTEKVGQIQKQMKQCC